VLVIDNILGNLPKGSIRRTIHAMPDIACQHKQVPSILRRWHKRRPRALTDIHVLRHAPGNMRRDVGNHREGIAARFVIARGP
jgi:hypothetical protein